MLQLLPLFSRSNPGERSQPLINLKRIARDGNRILTSLPQQLSERYGDPGLPNPGRPEDPEDTHQRGGGEALSGLYFFACEVKDRWWGFTEKVE
jgi:hypothetical protein